MFDTFALTSLILSTISVALSITAIAVIIGFKNSTHTIEWKPLESHKVEADPFAEEPIEMMDNPNKRPNRIKNPFPEEEVKDEDPFLDMEDPNTTSNNW